MVRVLSDTEQAKRGVERFIFFTDAVFAIAITLLALELRMPESADLDSETSVITGLLATIPSFFGYTLSFIVIGAIWATHVRKYRALVEYNKTFVLLNIILLLFVAFIPFPTALVSHSDTKTATILYASTFVMIAITSFIAWKYAINKKFLSANITESAIKSGLQNSVIMGCVFLLYIVIELFNADAAKFFWLLIIPAMHFVR